MFFSVHMMDGDPQQLLATKRQHMDPVVARLAPQHGAIATITVPTDTGIAVYNVWRSAEGAMKFSRESEAQQAQQASGLPAPSSFTPHPDAEVIIF
jgi:hypothetical protein